MPARANCRVSHRADAQLLQRTRAAREAGERRWGKGCEDQICPWKWGSSMCVPQIGAPRLSFLYRCLLGVDNPFITAFSRFGKLGKIWLQMAITPLEKFTANRHTKLWLYHWVVAMAQPPGDGAPPTMCGYPVECRTGSSCAWALPLGTPAATDHWGKPCRGVRSVEATAGFIET